MIITCNRVAGSIAKVEYDLIKIGERRWVEEIKEEA
jgi:hypothetical protein